MQPLSSSIFLLSWLPLSLVEQTSCLPIFQKCPQSSCGNLQIKHPFYLKSDASGCKTDPIYQLNCEGNRAIFQIFEPEKYVVTQIKHYYFSVVTDRFVQGSCTVLTVSPSVSMFKTYNYEASKWGSLVKCRQSISNDSMYMPVSCMSTNDSFVYLAVGSKAHQVRFFQPSGGAFELLQKGFTL